MSWVSVCISLNEWIVFSCSLSSSLPSSKDLFLSLARNHDVRHIFILCCSAEVFLFFAVLIWKTHFQRWRDDVIADWFDPFVMITRDLKSPSTLSLSVCLSISFSIHNLFFCRLQLIGSVWRSKQQFDSSSGILPKAKQTPAVQSSTTITRTALCQLVFLPINRLSFGSSRIGTTKDGAATNSINRM